MNTHPLLDWLCDAASEFVEGLADGFIIVSGGAQTATALLDASAAKPALTMQEIGISMLIAGAWYVAAFIKKNKPPFRRAAPAQPTP